MTSRPVNTWTYSIRPRPVLPHQLSREDIGGLLGRLDVLNSFLFTLWSAPNEIETEKDVFLGLSEMAKTLAEDVRHMIAEDVAFQDSQAEARKAGGAR